MAPITDSNGNGTHKHSLYTPSGMAQTENSLRMAINKNTGATIAPDYNALHKWSCENYGEFWNQLAIFADVMFTGECDEFVEPGSIASFPRWFPGRKLNYAQNCVTRGKPEDPAFITAYNATDFVTHTYADLRRDVERLGRQLSEMGVNEGDAVCGFLPNTYETAVAMFATAAIGAIWSSASVDFGPRGVLDRFTQVQPKVLFTVDAVRYKGKLFELHEKINEVVQGLTMVNKVILFKHLRPQDGSPRGDEAFTDAVRSKLVKYSDLQFEKLSEKTFEYAQVSFAHPLFIMFSSGTTGIPKAIVHSVGGTLLKHVEEHLIQGDSRSSDRMLFYTTCGWMMWNWLMTLAYIGASIVLYEESPLEPDAHILIKIAANTKCSIIGAGAKLYDEYTKMGTDFKKMYDLSNLRMILSTGSPLKAASFEFLSDYVAPGAVIGSISGGTDIIGCFMGASLSLPVVAGECQCLYLGMNIKAYNDDGCAVLDEQGELVCVTPFPSMPTHFLNDGQERTKYRAAYFERFPAVWAHGDFCVINSETGGVVMLGRSDATLNRGGVRIGTADIYAVVERFEEIDDCIVAGQAVPEDEDEHILLFLKLKNGTILDDSLKKRICTKIREMMSPRHIPNAIHSVDDIPYTNSGKKVEMAVKKIINGQSVQKASSLRNPDSLDIYKKFALV
ncbi:hypothetical protein PFISCL1PPCAC_27480 [Pristionchus fissidentatus]|uniref:Acetoacetyl-CoA synthetase n=1 Tax=Pristionchus fissidentatus TaxID=1538716 RepID=A0AAV5WXX5_9BILA|nr:hypothetical protein PFISCL1PPCAC_27480 [Pristionchus fissidentatus]